MLTPFGKTDRNVMTMIVTQFVTMTQTQYQWTRTNFKSRRGNSFQKTPENNNTNYKPKKNKINLKTSRNNIDARQNLKITFRNTHYTNAESTSQNSQQNNMGQTNTHNTNQQSTKQQRSSPKRDQEENNQATILVLDTQEQDDATSENQHFLFQDPNQIDWIEYR